MEGRSVAGHGLSCGTTKDRLRRVRNNERAIYYSFRQSCAYVDCRQSSLRTWRMVQFRVFRKRETNTLHDDGSSDAVDCLSAHVSSYRPSDRPPHRPFSEIRFDNPRPSKRNVRPHSPDYISPPPNPHVLHPTPPTLPSHISPSTLLFHHVQSRNVCAPLIPLSSPLPPTHV